MALAGGPGAVACLLVLALTVTAGDGATPTSSPSPAPAPAVDCTAEAFKLADCLDYVQPGSSASSRRPSKACCEEVKTAVQDDVAVGCLCAFFSSKELPIPLNTTRAFQLPAACGADPNVFTKCHAHAPSPSPAPAKGGAAAALAPTKGAAAARTPVASSSATAVLVVAAAALLASLHP
ncbi:hypothetical protein GUJ93_ZPchr0003g18416 [Zizania palustris]|uniref:Bifunctional inhibitor/plant lipid transfer protein/seed storage helical domain-containing protein n=1 Tax=Zizania palustris TaxID=103762 RepID=A0A8J5SMC5_ZIZPA|nr:hypothetical protein GUJ93_ZPchr0003g18416 [Zizania palustris]